MYDASKELLYYSQLHCPGGLRTIYHKVKMQRDSKPLPRMEMESCLMLLIPSQFWRRRCYRTVSEKEPHLYVEPPGKLRLFPA
jgi:hypothetical protein